MVGREYAVIAGEVDARRGDQGRPPGDKVFRASCPPPFGPACGGSKSLPAILSNGSAEFGVIMLLYLQQAWEARLAAGKNSESDLFDAIREGAVLRVRPKPMTAAVIIALPNRH